MEILQNTCLISAVLAWAVAQLCKLLIELIAHHQLDWERLTGDGGMPSGHSATVTALAAAARSPMVSSSVPSRSKITVRYMYDAFLSYSAAFHAVSRAISIISWKESCRS